MFCQLNLTRFPDQRRSRLPEGASPWIPAGGNEVASGARWKRFLLRHATASGLEAARAIGMLARTWRANHG